MRPEERDPEAEAILAGAEALEPVVRTETGPGRDLKDGARPRCAHVINGDAACEICGLAFGLAVEGLTDAALVAAQGRDIAMGGIPWVVDGIVPRLGMLGFLVAYAKVGKTTLGQALGAAVSRGAEFLGRPTSKVRVLYIAAEDPPEYTAWVARYLVVDPGEMTFYRRSVVLGDSDLARIVATVRAGGYGLVLIASWQAVIRGLVRDENDNAAAVMVVERVKEAARQTGIPWLIDAHSGKFEDQDDEADPSKAMRGASAAAAAADYTLWLRYANGAYGTKRKLSGRGRFVTLTPILIDYDVNTGEYTALGTTKSAAAETDWRLILETSGALTEELQSADAIARAIGLVSKKGKVGGQARARVLAAFRAHPAQVEETTTTRENGQRVFRFRRREPEAGATQ